MRQPDRQGEPAHRRIGRGLGRTFQIPRPLANLSLVENVMLAEQGQAGERLLANFLQPFRVAAQERAAEAGLLYGVDLGAHRIRGTDGNPITVTGTGLLARRLQQLAKGFDPDWQQPFVSVFGEVLGVQVANTLRSALQHARQGAIDLAHSAAEFITEESRDVVPRAELDAFHDDVEVRRDDVERLGARVQRLRGAA